MDMMQLEYFIKILDEKSFTAAAAAVSLSQPSLSKQIHRLETELNVTLFDRKHRTATLTAAGHAFEPYARAMLREQQKALSALKRFGDSGCLRVGCVDHMGRVGLTAPITSFLNERPDGSVSIDMERGTTDSLMEHLLAGKLDMAFIAHIIAPFSGGSNIDRYDLAGYHLYTLVEDAYHVIVPQGHPFTALDRKSITWQELAKERLIILDKSYGINRIIRDSFQFAELHPKVAFECDQVDAILGMVEEGFGAAILSKRIAATRYNVQAIPMEHPIGRNTALVVRKSVENGHRLAGDFVRHILQYYEEHSL